MDDFVRDEKTGNTLLHHACMVGNPQMVAAFLALGAKTTALNNDSKTPLQVACTRMNMKHEHIVNALKGCNYTLTDLDYTKCDHFEMRIFNLGMAQCQDENVSIYTEFKALLELAAEQHQTTKRADAQAVVVLIV